MTKFIEATFGTPTKTIPCTRCDNPDAHPPHDEKDGWHGPRPLKSLGVKMEGK